jgi:two-component system, sensor histidine kinase and response regulator
MKSMKNSFVRIFICLITVISIALFIIPDCELVCFARNELQYTPAEKEFIKVHPEIKLGVDPKFIPYEFIDTDGVYKGIAADYLKLIGQRTGLKLTVAKNLTWTEAYENAVQGKLDVLPCVSKTKERELYFLFSEPYYSFQRAIFINDSNQTIKSFDDLKNNTVAVQKNSSHHSYLKTFKNIKLSLYNTVEEALKAVSVGKETAFVGNFSTSNYLLKANGITGLKYVKIESEETQLLYFAVRKDWPILVDIINKALADITEEEKINIDNQWIGVENKIDYQLIIKIVGIIGSVILLIFIVSLYWIVKLKREVEIRKRAEEALKVAKEEAELANHIKSTFLARMSHEIRTPLNAITGMAYIIKKTKVTTTQKMYLEKIVRASRDMLGIINDILDFSKIEAGKIDIERISFNLDEVLEQIITIVAFKIDEQKIDFSMNKDSDIPIFFWGDPKRIQQVLLNVVNNAVKFTKEGNVCFSIKLVAKVKDSYVIDFSIKDSGIGMSNEQLEQLFTPFQQADSSISRRFGGTGLGLSIVKSLTHMMGGSVEVFSALNEGTTFHIRLTLEEDLNKHYSDKKMSAAAYFKNIHVLVVEKNKFYVNLLKDYLNSFGMIAEFAESEYRALQMIESVTCEKEKPYNLLIVDYETPIENGIEFYKKIKKLPYLKQVPKCILLLALSEEELFEKLEEEGLDFGITKPIIPSILYNSIVEIFKMEVLEIYENDSLEGNVDTFVAPYPYQILVVEDNKTNQFIAKSILEQSGFKVVITENGKEGYEFFKNNKTEIDLILMDLHMPVMDGLEASTKIREIDSNVPIIAMTADAITGVETKCKDVGIDYYISKPFDPDQFVETIWKVIKPYQKKMVFKEEYREEMKDDNTNIYSNIDKNNEAHIDNEIEEGKVEQKETSQDKSNDIEAVIDQNDGIKHIGGNRDLYLLVLKEYYDESKEIPFLLNKVIESQDYKQAVQIVHKIKGSSGSIGAKVLYELAKKFQSALANQDLSEISKLHKEFESALTKVLAKIELMLKESL